MPYKSMTDVPASIKGIKPPVTLEQANSIAASAEADGGDSWGAAVAQFKKSYTAKDGKWVKNAKSKEASSKEAVAGGPDMCACPDCSYTVKKKVGTPCRSVSCPECSATLIAGTISEYGYYGDESPVSSYVPSSITTFADLEAVEEAKDVAGRITQLTNQFTQLITNISYEETIDNRIAAYGTLFAEFVTRMKAIQSNTDNSTEDSVYEISVTDDSLYEISVPEGDPEPMSLQESAVSILSLKESDKKDGPLLVEVAPIQPGWGNERDNNYYSRKMLREHAKAFEGSKMYATDHRPDEKSVRTEVSQIIECPVRFDPGGAPIGIAAIYDTAFEESIRRREAVGRLGDLHLSIYADGEVRPGFSKDGRKGKYVEAIMPGGHVDWVTSAGAGGHAVGLIENTTQENTTQENITQENITQENGAVPALAESAINTALAGNKVGGDNMSATQKQEVPKKDVVEGAPAEKIEHSPVTETGTVSAVLREDEDSTDAGADATVPGDTTGKVPDDLPEGQVDAPADDESVPVAPTATENQASVTELYLSPQTVDELLDASKLPVLARERLAKERYLDVDAVKESVASMRSFLQEVTGAGKPAKMGESTRSPLQESDPKMSEEEYDAARDAVLAESGFIAPPPSTRTGKLGEWSQKKEDK